MKIFTTGEKIFHILFDFINKTVISENNFILIWSRKYCINPNSGFSTNATQYIYITCFI